MIKKLGTFLLGLVFLLLFCWIFLVTFIAQAPAEWLLVQAQQGLFGQQLAKNTQQLAWQDLKGNLSKGSARRLQLPFISFEEVSWNLSSWRLALANPSLELHLGETEQAWHLQASLLPWGNLTAHLQTGDLSLIKGRGLPWAMQGELSGQVSLVTNLTKPDINCQKLGGKLAGKLKVLQPMAIDLGEISLQPSCPEAHSLAWLLTAEQAGQHQLSLEGQANAETRRWSFTAQAKLEEEAKLQPALQMLGWRRNNQGGFQGRGSGRF